ncbi:hypothetical protein C3L33_04639, partial [Rhododendron williamsianum]
MAGGGEGGATTAGAASTGTTRSLQETPTWALATVCFIFIFGGLLIEYLIHRLTHVRAAYDQADISHWERRLAEEDDSSSSSDDCGEGKTSLMSAQGTNQLSIFIFVIAVMQVVYSGVTMGLGRAKVLQISSKLSILV